MEDNKELVEETTENVEEQATEELVDGAKVTEEVTEGGNSNQEVTDEQPSTEKVEKTYSKEELSDRIDKAVRRREAKLRREYEEKYGRLETVLSAGMQTDDISEITNQFEDFYTKKGIAIPQQPNYSESDLRILANAEAEDIISSGYDDIVEEVDRLADKGVDKMTPREKIVFQRLASERQKQESEKELASIGVGKEALEDSEFKEFAKKLNPDLSIKDQYELYSKFKPKPKVEQIGSMKNNTPSKTKDYYTPDEVDRLTKEQLRDPKVMEAVDSSMKIWYEQGIH